MKHNQLLIGILYLLTLFLMIILSYTIYQQNQELKQNQSILERQLYSLKNQVESVALNQVTIQKHSDLVEGINIKLSSLATALQFENGQSKQIQQLRIKFEKMTTSMSFFNDSFHQIPNIQSRLEVLLQKIEAIQKNSDEVANLIKKDSDLQAQIKEIQVQSNSIPKQIESSKEEVKTEIIDLKKIIQEIENNSSQVPLLQTQLELISEKIESDPFSKIEILGPFYPKYYEQIFNSKSSDWEIFQTIQSTSFQIKRNAIITLIATGHTKGESCQSRLTFLVDRKKINVEIESFGLGLVYTEWLPIYLTQVIKVEQGVHEFALGVAYDCGIVRFHGVSFVIRIDYIS